MPGPYDYTSAFDSLPSPQDAIMGGIKNGVAITDIQNQRAQQARDLVVQQQKQKTIQDLVNNPNATADDYANAAIKVPELHAQFKQAWDTKSTAQQQADLRDMTEWSSAIQSGQPKFASDGMRARADAIENTAGGPTPSSKALRAKADQVDANPDAANFILKSAIAAHPNGKAAIDGIVALNQDQRAAAVAPAGVRKANADASSAEYDAAAKNQGLVSQTLGSLQGKNAKPAQAITAVKSLQSRGILSADDAQALIDSVPTDPKALDAWFGQQRSAGMTSKEQQAYVAPDANTVATNDRIAKEGAANRAKDILVQKMIQDGKGDGGDETAFTKELAKIYPKGSPEYVEALRQRINKEAGINAGGGGGRSVVYNGRIIASGNEVAQALRNITELPVESNSGFMGMGQPKTSGLLSAGVAGLKNKLNDDQIKTYNTMWTGVSRNLGTLETSGLATTGDLIKSIDKLQFVPGDNGYNALRKLAEVRQITEAALESKLHDPAVPGQQRDHIKDILDAVHAAVPYTHSDLTRYDRAAQKNPELTFQEFAAQSVNKGKAAAPAITPGWSVEAH